MRRKSVTHVSKTCGTEEGEWEIGNRRLVLYARVRELAPLLSPSITGSFHWCCMEHIGFAIEQVKVQMGVLEQFYSHFTICKMGLK